jgi:hypothetical protein
MSTEPIATSTPQSSAPGASTCAACGAPLADDQRYCLHCGERRVATSTFLASGHPSNGFGAQPPAPPSGPSAGEGWRLNTTALIGGVGVLLLAMGVGVLIGRSGSAKQGAAAAQVVTVSSTPATNASSEPSFSSDWPSGTSGYTVQLQTLPQSSTKVSAVQAAKAAASAKGAKNVGALRSEDFSSLPGGNYVIYSGTYHKKAEAQKALVGLKKLFPAASVISVSAGAGSGKEGSSASESSSGGSGAGSNINKPAPPSVLENLKNSKGQNYVQKSKNLPNVVSTG